jgi:hypothetical protein
MDIQEIRLSNLRMLEAEAQSLKAIGEAMVRVVQARGRSDRAPDYPNVLSQYKGGKPIGTRMARLIEEAMKKEKGWMDSLQSGKIDEAMDAKEAGQIAMNIATAEEREIWLSMGRALAAKNGKASAALPFPKVPKGGKRKPPSGGTQ